MSARYETAARTRRSDGQFYQLGLPLGDCEFIEGHRDELLALYLQAADYDGWSIHERAEHLAAIAEYLFRLTETARPSDLPHLLAAGSGAVDIRPRTERHPRRSRHRLRPVIRAGPQPPCR